MAEGAAWRPGHVVNLSEVLVEVLDNIVDQHFPVATWTREELTRNFIPVKKFIDAVRVFCSIDSVDVRVDIAAEAIRLRKFRANNLCTCKEFYQFCLWLKKPEGMLIVNAAQRRMRLAKKVQEGLTVDDVAIISIAHEQRSEFHQSQKIKRATYTDYISELRRMISVAEEEMAADLAAGKDEYLPTSEWEEPDDMTIAELCWERYGNICAAEDRIQLELNEENLAEITVNYSEEIRNRKWKEFLAQGTRRDDLKVWAERRILELERAGEKKRSGTFVTTWRTQVVKWLRRFEPRRRSALLQGCVVGRVTVDPALRSTRPISSLIDYESVSAAPLITKTKPPINRRSEAAPLMMECLLSNNRLEVVRAPLCLSGGAIPHSRSKFEVLVRKVIGGGEMLKWAVESNKYRGGGNFSDALKLLCDAAEEDPGMLLHQCFTVEGARATLNLPCGLSVPSTRQDFVMKNFNNDATAGPALRAFGVYRKEGLQKELEDFAFDCMSLFAGGVCAEESLPFVTARVGYRTKLLDNAEALRKIRDGKAIGRCVMMLDAHEQAFSTPLYNVLSRLTHLQRFNRDSGFRNSIVRASSDWSRLWGEVREAACIVELDWSKFDRERPAEDIEFMIDVICSCFTPKNPFEERLMEGYHIMLRRSLLERVFLTDDGGIFSINGMVPSGSLWTGWLDTALNILYIRAVLVHINVLKEEAMPKCAGDDNLTLFYKDQSDERLRHMCSLLNRWFRAGIKDEDFKIHRPPFHVRRFQAVFPPDVDLSLGTSKIIDKARWVEIEGEMRICEAEGFSHRWKYSFAGCPSFLSCYWLEGGNSIRPAHVNLEKLLFPEGIHADIEDYEAAVISMAVDNPMNHHNVNHQMHRYVIIQQVKRLSCVGMRPEDILWLARIRPQEDEEVPFPYVAEWRRVNGYVDMEHVPRVKQYMKKFSDFVSGITSLYARAPSGGLDAWRFMDMIRNVNPVAQRQYGNTLEGWTSFLREHPVTRYLRPLGGRKRKVRSAEETSQSIINFRRFIQCHIAARGTAKMHSVEEYAKWLSDEIRLRQAERRNAQHS
ncbi:TPA_asm: fusion protein [Myosoton aquaticum amalgavirus 1]|nr:TPA_asm: fusion protein [Myosoton aquaticum amalgavirus 1]